MISSDQIEEWIHEVEQRPSSAGLIIQYISRRLSDLVERNEELLAENIELRLGRRVDDYESRIANLEYQLELLRRQFAGELVEQTHAATTSLSLVSYTTRGHAIRLEIDLQSLMSSQVIGSFGEQLTREALPRLLVTGPQEELLFIFDSGRTVTYPVTTVPVVEKDRLVWGQEPFVEPRGEEALAAVLPVAKMSLFDYCLQISRRGCIRKIIMSSFESHIAKAYIGSGVKQKPDQMFGLALAGKADHLIVVSREGYVLRTPVDQMAYTAERGAQAGNDGLPCQRLRTQGEVNIAGRDSKW